MTPNEQKMQEQINRLTYRLDRLERFIQYNGNSLLVKADIEFLGNVNLAGVTKLKGGPQITSGSGAPSGTPHRGSLYIDEVSNGYLYVYEAAGWNQLT